MIHSRVRSLVPLSMVLLGATASAVAQTPPLSNDTIAFINVNVVPMDRNHVLTRRTMMIGGGRILALGSSDSIVVPPHVRTVDGKNQLFVTPGFADMHTHIRYETDLTLMLANGITFTRNMRGKPWHIELRDKIARGQLLGPQILTAGPIFYGAPGSGASAAEARALVDSQADAHYDFIKVYDGLRPDAYAAVVSEAARRGLRVAGHIPGAPYGHGLKEALDAHQWTLEHAEEFIYHYFGDDLDTARIPAMAAEVKRSGAFVTPTLSIHPVLIAQWERHDSILASPDMRYVHPETYAWWKTDGGHDASLNKLFVPFLGALVRGLRDAHVPMLAGTDFYIFGAIAGYSLSHELEALVAAGLTPYEALATATRTPAEALNDTVNAGTVAVGKRADLVMLLGNPLDDIANSARVAGVVLRGRWIPGAELDSMKQRVAASFAPEQRLVDDLMRHGAAAVSLRPGAKRPAFGESTLSLIVDYYIGAKRPRDAVPIARVVAQAYPASASAWEELGDAYAAAERRPDARTAYAHALRIDPKSTSVNKKLAGLSESGH